MSEDQASSARRNRWGSRPSEAPTAAPAVSDQAALQALMADAGAAAREKQDQQKQQASKDKRLGPNNNNNDARSSRDSSNKRPKRDDNKNAPDSSYYGPGGGDHNNDAAENDSGGEPAVEKQKANFALSGALAKDSVKGNMYKGVLLKFQEPPEARAPNTSWRLYVYKGDEQTDILHISKQSAYLLGRLTDICDIPLAHPSCSSQHAVLQYRALPRKDEPSKLLCQPYLMDLESTNGSFLNGVQLDAARYYQLKKGDVLRFGASTREYVLLAA